VQPLYWDGEGLVQAGGLVADR